MTEEEGAITKIHAHDAERLLLQRGFCIEHPHVHHDLARLVMEAALELDPHPAVTFVAAAKAAGHDRIGKGEEGGVIRSLLPEALDDEIKLAIEHRLEPAARNVAIRAPVDRVAHLHVVGRHALGDRAGGAADPEKPAHHLLPGADLGKSAIPAWIEVDLEGLGMGVNHVAFIS